MQEFKVLPEHVGLRADIFIAQKYPKFTRSSLERLFDDKHVTIDGKFVKPSHKLREGEKLKVNDSVLKIKPAKIDLPIHFEDENVTVIDKPEGILTHAKGAINDEATVATFIAPKIKDKKLVGNRAGIVHRLDRGTSGLIITAKNSEAVTKLQKQFSQRKTKKTYLAIVEGVPSETKAIIDAPIDRNPKKPQTFRVSLNGKTAQTEYQVLKTFEVAGQVYSLLELKPTTGRTHQLRVHLKYIGHPIVGDRAYGKPAEHLYLHAAELELTLPNSERRVFRSKTPKYFDDFKKAEL
jgi:23S rRNA pseudouridine1911/1915/1917 synthase